MVIGGALPGTTLPRVQVTTPPTCMQVQPVPEALWKVTPAGRLSPVAVVDDALAEKPKREDGAPGVVVRGEGVAPGGFAPGGGGRASHPLPPRRARAASRGREHRARLRHHDRLGGVSAGRRA